MRLVAHGAPEITLGGESFQITIPRDRFLPFAIQGATYGKDAFLKAFNIPAFSVALLISRLTPSWPSLWHPASLLKDDWNCVIFPFYCLPFWILAGQGFDALKGRVIRWPWLLLGTLLAGFFLFLGCGLRFGMSAEDREGMAYVFIGLGLWTLMLAAHPIAWIRNYKHAKALAAANQSS